MGRRGDGETERRSAGATGDDTFWWGLQDTARLYRAQTGGPRVHAKTYSTRFTMHDRRTADIGAFLTEGRHRLPPGIKVDRLYAVNLLSKRGARDVHLPTHGRLCRPPPKPLFRFKQAIPWDPTPATPPGRPAPESLHTGPGHESWESPPGRCIGGTTLPCKQRTLSVQLDCSSCSRSCIGRAGQTDQDVLHKWSWRG